MSKLINTILLSTTLLMMSCSKGYTTTQQEAALETQYFSSPNDSSFDIRQMYMTLMNSAPLSFNIKTMQAGGIAPGFGMQIFGSRDRAFDGNKTDLAVLGFNKCIYKIWESLLEIVPGAAPVGRPVGIMTEPSLAPIATGSEAIIKMLSPRFMPLPLLVEQRMRRNLNVDKYSFHYYNIPSNIGNYINVDIVHRLFSSAYYDRKYSQSGMVENTLVLATDTLYLGLIGNRNVIVSGKLYAEYIKHIERQFLMHEYEDLSSLGYLVAAGCSFDDDQFVPSVLSIPSRAVKPLKTNSYSPPQESSVSGKASLKGKTVITFVDNPEQNKSEIQNQKLKNEGQKISLEKSLFPMDKMSLYPEIISQYNNLLTLDNKNNTKNAERYLVLVEKYLEMEKQDSKTAQLYVKLISRIPILADIYLQLESKSLQVAAVFLQMIEKHHPEIALLYAFMVSVDTQMADKFLELVEEHQDKVEYYLRKVFLTELPVMKPEHALPTEHIGSTATFTLEARPKTASANHGILRSDPLVVEQPVDSNPQIYVDSDTTQIFFLNLEDMISENQSTKTYLELLLTELIAAINEEYYMTGVPIPPIAFENETITLYGDNSEYNGFITIPQFVQKLYLHNNSLAGIKRFNFTNKNYIFEDNLSNLTFYLLGNNKLDIKTFGSLLSMSFDNTTETSSSGTLEIIDSEYIYHFKKRVLFFTGNYNKYEGTVKIPDTIKFVHVKSDMFTKIKYGDNKDLSGLTYHLLEDVKVDLNNIKDSTFEMSLSNDYTNSKYSSIKLTDSSNPTKITKVTFSGDNTNYKENSTANDNTGVVELTPYIKEVEFINTPKSFVNLIAFNTTRTILVNNVLSSDTSKIKVIPSDYSVNITYKTTEKRDSINNIEKYNRPGIIWNTNTLDDCFVDGKNLLNNLHLNIIKVDLKGSNDITITTADNIITLLGNNTEYTGTMTIPENVTDIFLRRISKIKNIVHTGDAELNNLHFHYEEIKPEVKSNNFCVPFDNMKKVIDSKHELCDEVKQTKDKLAAANSQITELNTEKQTNRDQLNTANSRITALEAENEDNKNKLLEAENNINDLNQKNEENKDKLNKAKDDINSLNKKNEDNKYKLSKAEELISKLSKENDENKYKLSEARKYIYYINKRNTQLKHNKYFDKSNRDTKTVKYSDRNAKYFNEFNKYNSREYFDKNSRYDSFYKDNISPKYKEKHFDDLKNEQNKFEQYKEEHNKYLEEYNKYDDIDYEYKPRIKHYNSLYNLDNLYEVNIDDDELSGDYTYEFCKDGTVKRYKKDI